jgi:hypothetical protein
MTKTAPLLATLLSTALLLSACGKPEAPEAETAAPTSADAASDTPDKVIEVEKTVVLKADDKTGELAIDLPGGTGASLRLSPDVVRKMGDESSFDVDGVGLYPGARVREIAATSREKGAETASSTTIRFAAPAKPGEVAQWYVAAFREKGHTATQKGNRVEGTTSEGSRITLDLTAEGDGTAGKMVVVDSKKAG